MSSGKPENRGRLEPESQIKVRFDEEGVLCTRPGGAREFVSWRDLGAVIIETNDTGPFGTDVFWLLLGEGGKSGCVIPQGADGETELLDRLQKLPGFDSRAVIEAMSSTEDQRYLCWKKG